jgi:hypothetical protein
MLQCACMLGAISALYSTAQRVVLSGGEEPLQRVEAPLKRVEAVARASFEAEHANLQRDFAVFKQVAAEALPLSALKKTVALASADPTPTASLRPTVAASPDPAPVVAPKPTVVASADPDAPVALPPQITAPATKPAFALGPQALAFDEPPNAYFAPKPIGPGSQIVLASLGLVPVSQKATATDIAQVEPPVHDFSYLRYYVYSETPPPEKPADTVLNSMKDIPVGTPLEEIKRVSAAFGIDYNYMKAVAKIESDFNPKNRTGSYVGLYQLSKYEFNRYGDGDILNARDNAVAAADKILTEAALFELQTHKKTTLSDLYLIHQQGIQGAAEHVSHPDRIAWQSMCATDEGQQKGERWCKRAIWANTLPEIKQVWKSVDNLPSGAFVQMWADRLSTLYDRYSRTADADLVKAK